MRLRNRLFLVLFGCIVFAIATPIIVLYARGFKYDFENNKITKTGTLVVRTEPSRAEVFLNDQDQENQTPANIRFLIPGDYVVRVEKEGFQPWSKRLPVASQFVTWANADRNAIVLFLQEPKLAQSFNAKSVLISEDSSEIVFEENGQYKFLNTKTSEVLSLGSSSQITVQNPGTGILTWRNANRIFEMLLSKTAKPIPADLLKNLSYAESDGNHIVFIFGKDLYSYDLNKLTLIEKNISGANLFSDEIWYVAGSTLKHFDFSDGKSKIVLTSLPLATQAHIIRQDSKIFLLLDSNLYVVNDTLEPIYSPVTFATYDPVSNQLLFGNANEVQIYNPSHKKSELILRSLDQIKNPVLNTDSGYLFYIQNDTLKAIELDGRDRRNVFPIVAKVGSNPLFQISPDASKLYLFDSTGGKIYSIR